jgi:hypothetical protein
MIRVLSAGLLVLVLAMCTPTEPCACPPPVTLAVIHGIVSGAGGGPVAAAPVEVDVYAGMCGAPNARRTTIGQTATQTDAQGRYGIQVMADIGDPQTACATAEVLTGAGRVAGAPTPVALRQAFPLDSARIDIVVP